ncbi:hypothetical protein F5B17DRAFT_420801 [Nemania serpens]|nr:hypothetical protein F5B17DRAFT_420801 [Nemania serpens]
MVLYIEDDSGSTVCQDNTIPPHDFVDLIKKWLLMIEKHLVLEYLILIRRTLETAESGGGSRTSSSSFT